MKKKFSKVLGLTLASAMVLAMVPAAIVGILAPQPLLAATIDMSDNTTHPANVNAIAITDSSGATLESIPSAGSIYIWLYDENYENAGAAGGKWSQDDFTQESVTVTLKTYRGDGTTLEATKSYTAVESGTNSKNFRTTAISVATLGVSPGYRLLPDLADANVWAPSPATGGTTVTDLGEDPTPPWFIRAKVEFDKQTYDIDDTMVLTVYDDLENTATTTSQDGSDFRGTVATKDCTIDMKNQGSTTSFKVAGLGETGVDTGIFEFTTTPNTADTNGLGIWCGDAMEVAYTSSANTTLGVTLTLDYTTATAYVSATSPSEVYFSPATIDPTDASVFIWVTDRDQSPTSVLNSDTISGAVTVENVTSGESATIATLTENTEAGLFRGTLTFGTSTFVISNGDQLKATYTDPSDSTDVSTAEAVVGTTVFLYDETDVEVDSYTTIQVAVDKVNTLNKDDYTIIVKDGYASSAETWPVDIDSGETGLTLKAETSGKVLTTSTATKDLFDVADTYFTIEGFTLSNTFATADQVNLIDILGSVTNLTITDCTFDLTVGYTDDHGIDSTTGTAAVTTTIDSCTFNVGKRAYGIVSSTNVNKFRVTDSTFTGTGCTLAASGWGIQITGVPVVLPNEFRVQNSTFDSLSEAFDINSAGNFTIRWNTIKNSTEATKGAINIHTANPNDVLIYGNSIQDNTGYPLYIVSSSTPTDTDLVFNNITGNTKGVNNNQSAFTLNATHNWWGTAAAPTDTTGAGTITTTFYLEAPVELTASYVQAAATAHDFQTDTGVEIHASTATGPVGAAVYTTTPKAALANATFYDAFIDASDETVATDTVTIYFYAPDVTADSVAKFWNATGGSWDECAYSDGTKNYGYNAYAEYIWVVAKQQTVTIPTFPTIQQLDGSEFAIVTEVRALQSIAVTPATASIIVDGTQQFIATGTYNVAPLTEVITTTVTWASSATSVATIAATTGLATGVAEGTTNITATLGTIVSPAAVLTVGITVKGDFDEDGDIDLTDFVSFVAAYGSSVGDSNYNVIGDFDDDGDIDLTDFVAFVAVYGT